MNGMTIYNVVDPTNPVEVFTLNTIMSGDRLKLIGDRVFIFSSYGTAVIENVPGTIVPP